MRDQVPNYPYLVIEGNIGAGKTSLARILANKFNTSLVLESFAENTFLPQFYEQPERFAFPLEMSFLAERFQQIKQEQEAASLSEKNLIGDYIFEKSLLFAGVTLNEAEFELFKRFYALINPGLKQPDLILYLHKSTDALLKNISKRGRDYEKSIPEEYLQKISDAYLKYLNNISNQRVIIINSDKIDFVNNSSDLLFILDLLNEEHPPMVKTIHV